MDEKERSKEIEQMFINKMNFKIYIYIYIHKRLNII